MTWYPVPNMTNTSGLLQYANTATSNAFWPGMLITLFLIVFITSSFGLKNPIKGFASASWLSALFGVLLWGMGLISSGYMLLMVLAVAISVILLTTDKG